jgi:hypothetical protein
MTSWLQSELLEEKEVADYGKSKIPRGEIEAPPLFPDLLLSPPRQLQVAEVPLKEVWPALCKMPLQRGSKKLAVAVSFSHINCSSAKEANNSYR